MSLGTLCRIIERNEIYIVPIIFGVLIAVIMLESLKVVFGSGKSSVILIISGLLLLMLLMVLHHLMRLKLEWGDSK